MTSKSEFPKTLVIKWGSVHLLAASFRGYGPVIAAYPPIAASSRYVGVSYNMGQEMS